MLENIIAYLLVGMVVSLIVTLKSETPIEPETMLPMGLIAFGWPIAMLYMVHILIKSIASEGEPNVVTRDKDSGNTDSSSVPGDNVVELPLRKNKKDTGS